MQFKSFHNLVLIFFMFVTVIVLGFTGLLNISAFNQNTTDSLISSYQVSGRECVRKIEYALRYGKTLASFYGIEELLDEVKNDFPEIKEVQIISADGEVLFNEHGIVRERFISEQLQEISVLDANFIIDGSSYTLIDQHYHVFLPITDPDQESNLQGSLHLFFPQEVISSFTVLYSRQLIGYLGLLAVLGIITLIILSRRIPFTTPAGEINKKTLLVVTLLLLGLIQVAFGLLNFNMFKSGYMETAQNNSALLSKIIQKDIESVVERGVPYNKLYNLEAYLERIAIAVPEIDTIQLSVGDGELLYSTADSDAPALPVEQKDPSMLYSQSLMTDNMGARADLQTILSAEYFAGKERDILLDSVTMLALSLILMVELVIFMLILLRYQFEKKLPGTSESGGACFDITIIRPLILIFSVSVFMSLSFIPLRMQELLKPLWGLSDSMIMGLPISAEMLFAGLAALLAGYLVDRRSWAAAFLVGVALFAAGLFLSYQAWSVLSFIVARAITGAGYGCTLMALRAFVNNRPSEKEKGEGFSSFISGLYAGFIIGVAVGAMLADRIGFARVFLVSLAFCLLAAVLIIYYLSLREIKTSQVRTPYHLGALFSAFFMQKETAACRAFVDNSQDVPQEPVEKKKGLLSFLGNLPVLGFFLFALLPLTICSMFVDYYFPVFAASQNISTSDVGRAFMLNGVAIVYLGPVLTAYTSKSLTLARSILVSGLIIVTAFLLFYFLGTVAAAFVVVILLGVSESFGLVALNSYFVNLKAVGSVGKGLALGYFTNIRDLGKMSGPIIFGGLMALGNTAIGIVGIITLGLLLMFLLSARLEKA